MYEEEATWDMGPRMIRTISIIGFYDREGQGRLGKFTPILMLWLFVKRLKSLIPTLKSSIR
jgi:hypothetical protein